MLKRSIMFCCGALLGVALLTIGVRAESIDGTTGTSIFKHYNHVFRDGDQAQGFVYFADGFTVLPGAAITMDCVTSVSGAIDLRGTGALYLARDLALDSHVTISNGGYFSSAGKVLALGGNLRIPSGKVIHCAGDMVIDGGGRTLHLEKDSQLFLDNQSTLTLRNMIIKTERSYPGQPALHVSTSLSKLCLDNVVLNLGNDLYLNKGQFFFHNDVLVTGTSALVYTSLAPSFVNSGSSLYFDHGTTFSYAPCTPSGNLLQLADASSTLAFDGATLKATGTGMQLTRGQVALSGEVGIDQRDYVMTLNSTAVDSLELQNAYSVSWAPNGKYVAIAFWSNGVQLYSVVDGQLYWVQTISLVNAYALCWSPDGKYLVVGRQEGTSYFELYSFNQEGFLYWVQQISTTTNSVKALSWSPDGKYLAVGLSISNNLKLYRFANGQLAEVQTITLEYQPHCLSWSPDGKFLAVGRVGNGYDFRLYRFTNGQLYHAQTISDLYHVRAVSWSPDGKYVVVGVGTPSNNLKLYRFTNGQLQNDGTVQTIDLGSPVYAASWSPDGKYVVVGTQSSGLKLYRFRNGQLQNDASVQTISVTNVYSLSWSPDQKYLAMGREVSSGTTLFIYESLFTSQAPENPIELGDGLTLENNCAITQVPASTVNILNGELRIALAGHALPSDPLNNVISGGTWKLEADGAQRFGPGRYVNAPIVYRDAQSLADGFTYNGLINFAQGFSVPAGDRVSLDLLQPVFGDIDLHDTASVVLERDLVLASGVQLVSGGTIEADDATLLLQGDCTIPASKILTLQGTITIDGNGNKLIFADDAQLKAASNAVIVMKNMTLKTTGTTNTLPLIDNGALGCSVTLNNVGFDFYHDVALSTNAIITQQAIINASRGVLPNTNIFSGDGATLLLQGDALIPAGKVIHCAGDIVIDGGGRTVYFEPNAQLMVDAKSTVTLRNMIISSEFMGVATPALQCDKTGKLCLDNVVLNLSNDLQIDQGTVFVHNDVVVSGTSSLFYQSPKLLSIAPHGTLYFDTGSTFSFAPKSAAFERLRLGSATSRLMFNGADFITTGDDLQFMRGQVLFDGLSHFEHYGADWFEDFDNPAKTLTHSIPNIRVASWSPDGGMLLVGYGEEGLNKQHSIQLYSFDGITLALQGNAIGYDYDIDYSRYVTSIAWSPDGAYVVVGTGRFYDMAGMYYWFDGQWYIYSVGVSGLTLVKDGSVSSLSEFINKVAWSSEGDFISIGGFEAYSWDESSNYYAKKLYVYSFNRNDNSVVNVTNSDIGAIGNSMSWAPDLWDDYYVALGLPGFQADGWPVVPALSDDGSPQEIRVYKDSAKNGVMTLFKTKSSVTGCKQVAWSPNGNWIAAARGDNGVTVYQWTGSDFGATEVSVALSGVMSVDWFANSEYLAVGYANDIKIYAFDGVSLTDTGIAFDGMTGIKNVHWVPDDGAHLLGRYTDNLDIFNTEFKREFIPAADKSIIFGDGVNPEHDCDVTMCSGARVLLKGNLVYNPVV